MNKVFIEERQLKANTNLGLDVAQHIQARYAEGKILIVAQKPRIFLPALKKQWDLIIERTMHERSSISQQARAIQLQKQISIMKNILFTLKEPLDFPQADIFIMSPGALQKSVLPYCMTMYITCGTNIEVLKPFIQTMPTRALVVFYDMQTLGKLRSID